MRFSRRCGLQLLGISFIGVVSGTYAARSWSDEDLVRSILERFLGPLAIADEDLAAFSAAYVEKRPWAIPGGQYGAAYSLAARLSLTDQLQTILSVDQLEHIERLERTLLAEFHTMTDVGWRERPEDQVRFVGASACLNPFAQFELA